VRVAKCDIPICFKYSWKCFELNDADQKQINPCIKNINLYERDYYCCAVSTSHINDKNNGNKYVLVSGLDTNATSLNVSVRYTNGRIANAAQHSIPVLITEFTSHLIVSPARNILPIQ
jgi:hypothetical protein